eukprot:304429_1
MAKEFLLVFGFVREYEHNIPFTIPYDITHFLSSWISFTDFFDKEISDDGIIFESRNDDDKYSTIQRKDDTNYILKCAFGALIIKKGQQQIWKFKLNNTSTKTIQFIVGIMDNNKIETRDKRDIGDFTDTINGGYGLWYGNRFALYHNSDGSETQYLYASQLKFNDGNVITMKLDLTQKCSKCGILSYEIDNCKLRNNIVNNTYSNIAYDDIDINKDYRCAVALYHEGNIISILSNNSIDVNDYKFVF